MTVEENNTSKERNTSEAIARIMEVTGIKDMAIIKNAVEYCKKTTGKPSAHIDHIVDVLIDQKLNENTYPLRNNQTTEDSKTPFYFGAVGGQISKEDEEISRALEQSLASKFKSEKEESEGYGFFTSPNPHERRRDKDMPVGIANVGCTCWFSAVIQTLFWIPKFRKLIIEFELDKDMALDSITTKLIIELRKLFAMLISTSQKYIDPSNVVDIFKNILGNQTLDANKQQDVSEFLHKLLDMIEEAMKCQWIPEKESHNNKIQQTFYGKLVKESLDEDNKSRKVVEVMGQLPLSIDGLSTLHEAIEQAMDTGSTQDNESWFEELPPVLTLELLRFKYNMSSMMAEKINDPIEFPNVIYMDRYMECNKSDIRKKRRECNRIKKELFILKKKLDKYLNYNAAAPFVALDVILRLTLQFAEDSNQNFKRRNLSSEPDNENKFCDEGSVLNVDLVDSDAAVLEKLSDGDQIVPNEDQLISSLNKISLNEKEAPQNILDNIETLEDKLHLNFNEDNKLYNLENKDSMNKTTDQTLMEFRFKEINDENMTSEDQQLLEGSEVDCKSNQEGILTKVLDLIDQDTNMKEFEASSDLVEAKQSDAKLDVEPNLSIKLEKTEDKKMVDVNLSKEPNNLKLNCSDPDLALVKPRYILDGEEEVLRNCLTRWEHEVQDDIQKLKVEIREKEKIIESMYCDVSLMKYPYRLHAVLIHEGAVSLGHYWAYVCTNPTTDTWHKFNDILVTKASVDEMLRDGTGSEKGSSNAYCFVYVNDNEPALFQVTLENPLPADLIQLTKANEELFEKQINDWDAKLSATDANADDAKDQGSKEEEIKEDEPFVDQEENENVTIGQKACTELRYETLNMRHSYLSAMSSLSIVEEICLHPNFNENSLEDIFKQKFDELLALNKTDQLLKPCANKLCYPDERIDDVLNFFLLNNVDSALLWVCFLEKLQVTSLKGLQEKLIVKCATCLLKKYEDSYNLILYQKWHFIYHIFRESVISLVCSLEAFEWRCYEASILPIMNAVYLNNSLLAFGDQARLNQEILLLYRRQSLLKYSQQLMRDLQLSNLTTSKDFFNIFLPSLFSLIKPVTFDISKCLQIDLSLVYPNTDFIPQQSQVFISKEPIELFQDPAFDQSLEMKEKTSNIDPCITQPEMASSLHSINQSQETESSTHAHCRFSSSSLAYMPELVNSLPLLPDDSKVVELVRQGWCELLSENLPDKNSELLSRYLCALMDEGSCACLTFPFEQTHRKEKSDSDLSTRYTKVAEFVNNVVNVNNL